MPLVIARAGGEPLFPLYWTPYSKLIERVDSCVLSPLDHEVIQVLECFHPLESSMLIALLVAKVVVLQVNGQVDDVL